MTPPQPCKRIWPEIEKLAKEHSNVNVVKVDCEELEAVAQEYGVKSFPTFKVWQGSGGDGMQAAYRDSVAVRPSQ